MKSRESEKPQKTILILGAGVMQVVGIRAAKELGYRTCVVDGSDSAVGISEADFFEVADLKYPDEVIRVAEKWNRKFHLDGVFTAGTDFSLTVAKVAAHFGLPGIPIECALRATDKGVMRECFAANEVPIPQFRVVKNIEALEGENCLSLFKSCGYPFVVKPVDNMGARGIRLCSNSSELRQFVQEAFKYSRSGRVIIEEYIEGPEFSIDSLVVDGQVTIMGFAERHIFFPPYFIEMGHTMPVDPTHFTQEVLEVVKAAFVKGVHAIGIKNGVAKGDVKLRFEKEGPKAYIGEIAARLSGGYMSGWTFPYATHFPLTAKAIQIAMGESVGPLNYQYEEVAIERAFISLPGEVAAIELPSSKLQAAIRDRFIRIKVGDRVKFPVNNVEKCGNIILVGKDRDLLEGQAKAFLQETLIRLKANDVETKNYLINGKNEVEIPLIFDLKEKKDYDEKSFSISFCKLPTNKKEQDACKNCFVVSKCPWESQSMDWEGRDIEACWKQLEAEGVFVKEVPQEATIYPISSSLFSKIFSRGGRQGVYWLLDSMNENRECFI